MVMVTIGLLILMRGLVLLVWGAQERPVPRSSSRPQPIILGELLIPRPLLAGGACTVVAAVGPVLVLQPHAAPGWR